jgi:hypothetical protein
MFLASSRNSSRNRLYSLAPQFIASKTERVLDFGYCLLRMNVGAEQH